MFKITPNLAAAMLAGVKSSLDGGRIYIYAGTVPTNAGDALNMAATHTELAVLTLNGGGVTGLTFASPSGAVVSKASEQWSGTIVFDGFEDSETTLTPTFFRFCASGDNGRGATSDARIQGTAGGPTSTADMKLGSDTLTANGANTTAAAIFNFRINSLG